MGGSTLHGLRSGQPPRFEGERVCGIDFHSTFHCLLGTRVSVVECGLVEPAQRLLGARMVVSEVGMEAVAFGGLGVAAHQFAIAAGADLLVLAGFATGKTRQVGVVASSEAVQRSG